MNDWKLPIFNRMSRVTYSGETGYTTPNVTYTYDQARSGYFNDGALTKVETEAVGDALSTKTEFDYDLMGRVVKHRQWIDEQQYSLEYTYNLAGQLTSEKYPDGRVVTNSYDSKGRLSAIADSSRTYLSGLGYLGKGGSISAMNFGNGTTETFALNDRYQMINQTLSKASSVLQKFDYGYGQIDGSGNLDTTKNNGQLSKVESFIGSNKQWTQKFNYDAIGRLKQSEEKRGDTNALTYKQTFDFDRFGNMYRKAANNGTSGQEHPLPYKAIEDTHINKATNRFTTQTFATRTVYDEAGNVTLDNKFRNLNLTYDANGRVVKAVTTIGMVDPPEAMSVYDAAGMRVAEQVNDIWRFLIYDIGGKLVSEYGGPQPMDSGGVKYYMSDWQGSTRAVMSATGFVKGRADYTAYGEEISSGKGLRTTAQGFGSAQNPRQKYGLTERDSATAMDHTWWRKHENRAGRWTSPDPYGGSMDTGNPQSFNRYSYVTNNPISFVDPTGLYEACVHEAMTEFLANLAKLGGDVASKLGLYAGDRHPESADSTKIKATNPKNVGRCALGYGPTVEIHFPSWAQLRKNIRDYGTYMGKEDYVKAAHMIHSIQDSLGAHKDYDNRSCQGHASQYIDGTRPDAEIGDKKFFDAAEKSLQVMGGSSYGLSKQEKSDLIKAVIAGCGGTTLNNRHVSATSGWGGGLVEWESGGSVTVCYQGQCV